MTEDDSSAAQKAGRLLQVLGTGFGLAVIIGNTIGAGILRTPGEVAAQLPQAWLFLSVWIVGGLYALVSAVSIAELGTMIPRSGGQYVFARRALGDYAGFVVGWSDWISTCGTTAAVSIVIGEYLSILFPPLAGRSVSLAVIVTLLFAGLQWRGISWGSGIQNFTSLLKALAFLALIAACFLLGGQGGAAPARTAASASASLFVAFVIALQAVIYTYDGWTGVIYFSEEVRESARDVPRSLFLGVLSVMAIYLLVNLAFLYVLPLERIAGNTMVAGAAAEAIFGTYGGTMIRSLMIVSMLSGINAYHLMATRVLFGLSRDGLFLKHLVSVNKGGTPVPALWLSAAVSVLFILSGSFNKVIAVLAFFFVINYTLSFVSLFILRRREPHLARPYRAWGYPWTTALSFFGSVAFLIGVVAGDTANSMWALLLLAASWPIYRLVRRFATAEG